MSTISSKASSRLQDLEGGMVEGDIAAEAGVDNL